MQPHVFLLHREHPASFFFIVSSDRFSFLAGHILTTTDGFFPASASSAHLLPSRLCLLSGPIHRLFAARGRGGTTTCHWSPAAPDLYTPATWRLRRPSPRTYRPCHLSESGQKVYKADAVGPQDHRPRRKRASSAYDTDGPAPSASGSWAQARAVSFQLPILEVNNSEQISTSSIHSPTLGT
jgi:hypothetical protein